MQLAKSGLDDGLFFCFICHWVTTKCIRFRRLCYFEFLVLNVAHLKKMIFFLLNFWFLPAEGETYTHTNFIHRALSLTLSRFSLTTSVLNVNENVNEVFGFSLFSQILGSYVKGVDVVAELRGPVVE